MPEKKTALQEYREKPIRPDRWAAARILYETDPRMSLLHCAKEMGINRQTLQNRANKEGWQKRTLVPADAGEQAHAIADRYQTKLSELGPEITEEGRQQVVVETAAEVSIDMRAQLIDRHRREWGAIRALVYDSLKKKTYGDISKLAKISAETLQIIQSNERKAWGIDRPDGDNKMTVVIDRG